MPRSTLAVSCLLHAFALTAAAWLLGAGTTVARLKPARVAIAAAADAVPPAAALRPEVDYAVEPEPDPPPLVETEVGDEATPPDAAPWSEAADPVLAPPALPPLAQCLAAVRRAPAPSPPAAASPELPVAPPAEARAAVLVPLPGCHAAPDYPPLARRRGWQGTVVVHITCAVDGEVLSAEVLASSGHPVLDEAACAAARAWRFAGGPGAIDQAFVFQLRP